MGRQDFQCRDKTWKNMVESEQMPSDTEQVECRVHTCGKLFSR